MTEEAKKNAAPDFSIRLGDYQVAGWAVLNKEGKPVTGKDGSVLYSGNIGPAHLAEIPELDPENITGSKDGKVQSNLWVNLDKGWITVVATKLVEKDGQNVREALGKDVPFLANIYAQGFNSKGTAYFSGAVAPKLGEQAVRITEELDGRTINVSGYASGNSEMKKKTLDLFDAGLKFGQEQRNDRKSQREAEESKGASQPAPSSKHESNDFDDDIPF